MGAGFVLAMNPYKFVPGGVCSMVSCCANIFPSVPGRYVRLHVFDIPLMLIAMLVSAAVSARARCWRRSYAPGFMNVLTRLVYPNPEAVESLDPSLLLGGRWTLSNDLLLTCVIAPW